MADHVEVLRELRKLCDKPNSAYGPALDAAIRALSPAGGGEWAEKARQMIVELRDYVVNERDAQVLPRKRAGYQRELDEIDALLAASPQPEPGATINVK